MVRAPYGQPGYYRTYMDHVAACIAAQGSGIGSAPEPEFSPSDISGLVLWLRYDQGTWQDTVGGTAATIGDPVGAWGDQSGNSNNATEATNKPTLATDGIEFDGTNDLLSIADDPTLKIKNSTIFLAYEFTDLTNEVSVFQKTTNYITNGVSLLYSVLAGRYQGGTDWIDWNKVASVSTDTIEIITMALDDATATATLYRNGANIDSGATTITETTAPITLGAGNYGSGIVYNPIRYKHVIQYNRILTASERADVEQWIADNS